MEPEADKRFQTSADVAAELAKLDDEGKVIPIARRLTWRMGTAAAVVVAALLAGTYYVTRQAVAPAVAPAVIRLPGGKPRTSRLAPLGAASTLTPSATGRFATPLSSLNTSRAG